jgi:hypothetical protein
VSLQPTRREGADRTDERVEKVRRWTARVHNKRSGILKYAFQAFETILVRLRGGISGWKFRRWSYRRMIKLAQGRGREMELVACA